MALGLITSSAALSLPPDTPVHQYTEQRWGVADGMPQTTGQAITQSRSGELWIGTQNGLARFDGVDFQIFNTEDYPGLPVPYINALHEDEDGRLWIATEQGLSLLENQDIRVIDAGDEATGPVRDLLPAEQPNRLWLAAENGLFLASPDGITRREGINGALFSLARDPDGRLLVGGRGHIWRLRDNGDEVFPFPSADADQEVRGLLVHGDRLIQGLSNGLRIAPLDNPTDWQAEHLPKREVEALLMDDAGSLWVATVSGLYRQRPDESRPQSVRTAGLTETEWLRALFRDDEGNLWIGAQARGIVRLSPGPFRRFGAMDGLVDDIVWSFFEDPAGDIWVGSNEHGAYRKQGERFEQVMVPEALPHAMTMGFLLDEDNRFWVATRGGVAWYDWPSLEAIAVPDELPNAGVFGITQASDGRVWLATREGLYWWRDGELQRIDESRGLTQQRTRDVLEDRQGRIWVATDTGIFRGDADGVRRVAPDSSLADYNVSALFELDGTVWAMLQGAMARFVDDELRLYRDGNGLKASVGSFMALDDDGYIWSTTHEGIQRIHRSQFDAFDRNERDHFEAEVFGRLTDPVAAQCNGGHGQAGLFQADQQVLWCPSLEGALRLDLNRASEMKSAPRPRFRQLRSGGQRYPLDFATQADLVLPPNARDLEIDFSGLHFRHPAGVEYRFRLQGFGQEWQDAGNRRTAFYTNLAPGEYRFQLIARNERGIESAEAAELTLHLSPRFHETLWFRGLMLLLLLLLAYGLWRYSVRQLHRRRNLLEQMVRKRTRQLHEANRRLRQASITDPLTGLRNRRYLSDQLPHDIAQVDRAYTRESHNPNRDITFLMIDLDHFKRINDVCGHRTGDEILSQFAQVIAGQVRESDYVIRWGGEEFLVVARHSERNQAAACADRIISAVREHAFLTDQGELDCSCSIGVSCYPALAGNPDALDWEDIIELADAANYIAKDEGRDRWVEIEVNEDTDPSGLMPRFRRDGANRMAADNQIRITREKPVANEDDSGS